MDGIVRLNENENLVHNSKEEHEIHNSPLSLTIPLEVVQGFGEDGIVSLNENENLVQNSKEEHEIHNSPLSLTIPLEVVQGFGEVCASSVSGSKLIPHFVGMGFSEEMVIRAILENGEGDTEVVLEALLTYSALEKSPLRRECSPTNLCPSKRERDSLDDDLSDVDNCLEYEEIMENLSEREKKFLLLVDMGFHADEATSAMNICGPDASLLELADSISAAQMASTFDAHLGKPPCSNSNKDEESMENLSEREKNFLLLVDMGYCIGEATSAVNRCGSNASILELADSICAAQMENTSDAHLGEPPHSNFNEHKSGSKLFHNHLRENKRKRMSEEKDTQRDRFHFQSGQKEPMDNILVDEDEVPLNFCISDPMFGFGVPNEPMLINHRNLPKAAIGPPYFYYENVAFAPKGVWETMSRFLYDIEPEFVDSKHFCAASRKRGYIHNLPIQNRFPLRPIPPLTIHEALPMTKKWWPSWDRRMKLNCLKTSTASAKVPEKIRNLLTNSDDPPPLKVQQYVFKQCRELNLVWVGLHKVAPLEPDEIEMLLGFPKNHTRGGGICRTDRLHSLGNSFQIDTVAFHLSVLKNMFPNGITLLSLFSGIGGAEVALHRLGIRLKNVVSVEISEINRNILQSWWDQTSQTGKLVPIEDVQQLNRDRLTQMINSFGGFDLIIGGSPCNNLSGSNRVSRDGLNGTQSVLFYDYIRILDLVKGIMMTNM